MTRLKMPFARCKISLSASLFVSQTFDRTDQWSVNSFLEFMLFLARVTSPPNSTSRRFPTYLLMTLLLYFLYLIGKEIYHFEYITEGKSGRMHGEGIIIIPTPCILPDFPSVSSLPFLSCHRTTTTTTTCYFVQRSWSLFLLKFNVI